MKKSKQGQVGIYITFFVAAILIVTITAVLAPMGVLFSSEMYAAGETILLEANDTIANIQDPTIRAQYQEMVSEAQAASATNIQVNSDIFQYGWVIVLVLVALILFMITRALIEFGGGRGLV